jgi:hypothetical protein
MMARGSASVWWPRMKEDVVRVQSLCSECHANALSQPKEPPVDPPTQTYLFQLVCAEFFSLKGRQYLVLVDRYSDWSSMHLLRMEASAKEVVGVLQAHCETF